MSKTPIAAIALLALALPAGPAAPQESRPPFPPHTVPNSQLRVLAPTAAGRHSQLHIGLPASYSREEGHAADFLRTIETEIIPFVEREYRADPSYRVLAGASLGGLFTLYSMYTKPDLFQAYIAATPAVTVGSDWLFGYEEESAKAGRPLRARLFVSGGGNESPAFMAGILRFNQRIASRRSPGLAYEFRIIDGERHAGMQLESYTRGLRFAFAPLAPETGPTPGR